MFVYATQTMLELIVQFQCATVSTQPTPLKFAQVVEVVPVQTLVCALKTGLVISVKCQFVMVF